MRRSIKALCNFIVTILVVIGLLYITFFTSIPNKTGNLMRQKLEEYQSEFEEYNKEFVINDLEIEMKDYYYNHLSDDQKVIYESIANGVKKFEGEFLVRNYIAGSKEEFANEVSEAISAFINDHPEVFYLQSFYSSYVVEGFNGGIGYIKLNYTEESIEAVNQKLDIIRNKIEEYLIGLDGKSEYEKELFIHDKFAETVNYIQSDDLERKYHTIEGPMIENDGVCDGFTKSLQIIFNKCGINSIIVLGNLEERPHAWNLVSVDDQWYHMDVTSSRSIYTETEIVTHAYFNLNNERLIEICTLDDINKLPNVDSDEYNYYKYNDYHIGANEDIKKELTRIYNESIDKKFIEFYLEGDVSERITEVLVSLREIDKSFINGNKLYYYNIKNAIIIPKK